MGTWLRSVVGGHIRYYGVPTNSHALRIFRFQVGRLWHRALSRRSQNGRVAWDRMRRLIDRWLPPARVCHPYPLRRLGVTLVQTLQYGTPLSQALRTLSAEMRQEALTRFEARAGRLPALLTVPMIVFILPCVFLIVGGPAIVHILQLMRQ